MLLISWIVAPQAQQHVRGLANVVQRDVGRGGAEQGAASTADQGDDHAVLGLVLQGVEQRHGARHTVLVGDGVRSLGDTDSVQVVASSVLVLGHHMAGVDAVLEEILRGLSHSHSGLASTDNNDGLRLTSSVNTNAQSYPTGTPSMESLLVFR